MRYVLTKPRSSMSAFISRISMMGLAIAIALLITVLSIMNGFERDMRERILGLLPQISVYSPYSETDWDYVSKVVKQHGDVKATAPFVNLQGLLVKGRKTEAVLAVGVDPTQEADVSVIDQYIQVDVLAQLKEHQVIVGKGLAESLKLKQGSSVVFLMPQSAQDDGAAKLSKFKVLDVLDSGTEIDGSVLLLNIKTAQSINTTTSQALRVSTNELFNAPVISSDLMMQLPKGFVVTDWTSTYGNLYAAIGLSKRLLLLLIFIVIIVAMFNIISSLVLLVNNKRADIAILRTMGQTPVNIMLVFLVQGTFIALIGTVLGVVLGIVFTFSINGIVKLIEAVFSYKLLNPDVYPLNYLPIDIRMSDILFVCGVSIATGVVTTIYPALRAANVMPAQALSNAKN
ncbi:MAG: lipoprotein-releasing ABC transporter permease subunit [Pseudomonadota bacterium]